MQESNAESQSSPIQPFKDLMNTSPDNIRRKNREAIKSMHPLFLTFAILMSLPFLVIGISIGWNNARLALFEGDAEGIITTIRAEWEIRDGRQSTAYYPTFEFVTADGKNVRVESKSGLGGSTSFTEGEKVAIAYDRKYPENAVINDERSWIFPSFFAGMGALFLMVFSILAWKRYEFRKKDSDLTSQSQRSL